MTDVTQILSQIEQGDPAASDRLLPLVYEELRKLAAAKLANEKPGQTLQATALVHDAYIRLVDVEQAQHWNSRGHFFAAAAQAMRRILIDRARRKGREKRGGGLKRINLDEVDVVAADPENLLMLDDVLERLASEDPVAAELTRLQFYSGLSTSEAARALGMSPATGYRHWAYARVPAG